MRRFRGCMEIFSGVFTIWLAGRLPQPQVDWLPRTWRIRRFGSLLRGSTQILRGISHGLLDPNGRAARELEHIATRLEGWLAIIGGLAALRVLQRIPQRPPTEDLSSPSMQTVRAFGTLAGIGSIMQGVADGVMVYPPRWYARVMRRAGSTLLLTSTALPLAGLAIRIVRGNRQRPAHEPEMRNAITTDTTDWMQGQLLRTMHHRLGITGKISIAVGMYNLDDNQFRVTHPLGDRPPAVGEQLRLTWGRPPNSQEIAIEITGIIHDPTQEERLIYAFRCV